MTSCADTNSKSFPWVKPRACLAWHLLLRAASALFLLLSIGSARASVTDSLQYPATGFWNGFLDQTNVLECGNFGSNSAKLEVRLFDQFGETLGVNVVQLIGFGTRHVILNELSDLRDRYGTYRISAVEGSALSNVRCATAVYRFSSKLDRSVDYAYMLPVKNLFSGRTSGLFNSMNPEAGNTPVYNWLSIYNPAAQPLHLRLPLFDLNGVKTSEQMLVIAAGERRDVPLGHNNAANGAQHVGMYEILPDNGGAPYAAFLMRYGSNGLDFRFAFPLFPTAGSSVLLTAFAATVNNAFNWAEVANGADEPCDVQLRVRDRAGQVLSTSIQRVAAHGQVHYFVNGVLGASNLGTFEAEPLCSGGKLLLQNLYYGFSPRPERIVWAYAAQDELVRANDEHRLGFLSNTFLGMANWLKIRNLDTVARVSRLESFVSSGTRAKEDFLSLMKAEATDIPLHELLGSNNTGLSYLSAPDQTEGAQGELLRVFLGSGGQVNSVMYVPPLPFPEAASAVKLQLVTTGLLSPVALTQAGDGSGRLFISEREGRVKIVENGALLPTPFLDLSSKVSTEGEMGLLSIAFHPQYAQNRKFYAIYNEANFDTVLSEFEASLADANVADSGSEREILRVPQPHYFHKGGQLAFGPDGYLYLSLGDGGLSGDETGNGQNLGTLLGKILRLDISTSPYRAPADNPFVGISGARPEIWAYGFRNPWRFSFDSLNGEMIAGDVGENSIEEIDLVQRGGNYGWNGLEGSRCFLPLTGCQRAGTILPIGEYIHAEGLAVVGGFVYRGPAIPSLKGRYLFADYVSGRIWALSKSENGTWGRSQLLHENFYISALGEDAEKELYVLNFFGELYKIVPVL